MNSDTAYDKMRAAYAEMRIAATKVLTSVLTDPDVIYDDSSAFCVQDLRVGDVVVDSTLAPGPGRTAIRLQQGRRQLVQVVKRTPTSVVVQHITSHDNAGRGLLVPFTDGALAPARWYDSTARNLYRVGNIDVLREAIENSPHYQAFEKARLAHNAAEAAWTEAMDAEERDHEKAEARAEAQAALVNAALGFEVFEVDYDNNLTRQRPRNPFREVPHAALVQMLKGNDAATEQDFARLEQADAGYEA